MYPVCENLPAFVCGESYSQWRSGKVRRYSGKPVPLFCVDDDVVAFFQAFYKVHAPVVQVDVIKIAGKGRNAGIPFLAEDVNADMWETGGHCVYRRKEKEKVPDAAGTDKENTARTLHVDGGRGARTRQKSHNTFAHDSIQCF